VADRLYKIRHGLNILGVQQPLALFEPPINPMALVRAVAGAGGLAGLVEGAAAVDVPHYRFTFILAKAQALAQKVAQLCSALLAGMSRVEYSVRWQRGFRLSPRHMWAFSLLV